MAEPGSALGSGAIRIEGALIAPAKLDQIAAAPEDARRRESYGIPKGLTLREEAARAFRIARASFAEIAVSTAPSPGATRRFVATLLQDALGFSDLTEAAPGLDGTPVPAFTASGDVVPIFIAPFARSLEHGAASADGRGAAPAAALQDWLNADHRSPRHQSLWGLCCNGSELRLLRQNRSLTRPTAITADLKAIIEAGSLADFSLFFLLFHRTRFAVREAPAARCPLETWREEGLKEGVAARERLREGVEAALLELGTGFLAQSQNHALAEQLQSGALPLNDFFAELLRLVYRLIFLLTAEARDLLHPASARKEARELYECGYSLSRLAKRAVRRSTDRHDDLWQGLRIVFQALARGEPRLGLPALDGLFARDSLPILAPLALSNRALLGAVFRLAWLREPSGLFPVNWRDMQTEELGSVYESLLELTPELADDGRALGFAAGAETKGNARKITGSYYTPDALVQALLDSALDPALDRVMAEADDPATALLELRVLDPACGSGHFLLAAARRIATRLARARVGENPPREAYQRALRDVARACLYGVDRNGMAVELAKVALWIETLDPGKPLGFLDANIRCGDALLGVFDLAALGKGIPDAAYKPLTGDDKRTAKYYAARNRDEKRGQGRLDTLPPQSSVASFAAEERAFRALPEDDPDELAEKRRRFLARLSGPRRHAAREAADLYTAAFLLAKTGAAPRLGEDAKIPTTAEVWRALAGGQASPRLVGLAVGVTGEARAFHWPLEFPEVMTAGGFDVVLANPPWERIKLEEQEFFAARDPEIAEAPNAAARNRKIEQLKNAPEGSAARALYAEFEAAKRLAEASSVFAREGGRFPLTGRGDVNTYALFAELFSRLISPRGRAGMIVPTGIATDATTAPFFASLIQNKRLVRLIDFENRAGLFAAIDSRMKFSLLTIGHAAEDVEFAFFLTDPAQWTDPRRRFTLSPADIARINPNTKTAPVFRSRYDAELTARIYSCVPVLIDETKGDTGNPWNVSFARLFDMSNDSGLFRTAAQLRGLGFTRDGTDWVNANERYVPLYEAKMIHQFDHRWATYDGLETRDVAEAEKSNPAFEPSPRYWVPEAEVESRLEAKHWARGWLMGWRDICRATDARTVIATAFPRVGVGHTAPLLFVETEPKRWVALCGNANALVLDYVARQKVGGTHLTYGYLEQFPILPPSAYTPADLDFIAPRVLELSYTSYAMTPFARDLGYDGKPFAWDEDRRARLRAELDAFYAKKYGLTRDELRYILDPADALGADYPSETFRVLKKNEIARFGEYRTQRLVMAAWDRQSHSGA